MKKWAGNRGAPEATSRNGNIAAFLNRKRY
jgi:hypothetical protein